GHPGEGATRAGHLLRRGAYQSAVVHPLQPGEACCAPVSVGPTHTAPPTTRAQECRRWHRARLLGGAYRRIRPALGEFTRTIDVIGETFSGERMADHERLAERVADTGNRWGCNDPRVNGTLWWYSASSTMVAALCAVC